MLTLPEKLLFAVAVAASLGLSYVTFGRMIRVIRRGQGALLLDHLPSRVMKGLLALASQGRIIRNRKVASLFHYGVAWGFIFYLLVNAVDVLEGYVPGLRFLGDGAVSYTHLTLPTNREV